jgi:hypothetical protein
MEKKPIQLLRHHAQETLPYWLETKHESVEALVYRHILPHLELDVVENEPAYEFLKNSRSRLLMAHGLLTAIQNFLDGNYEIIPDFNPETNQPNTDHICDHCGNNVKGLCIHQLDLTDSKKVRPAKLSR